MASGSYEAACEIRGAVQQLVDVQERQTEVLATVVQELRLLRDRMGACAGNLAEIDGRLEAAYREGWGK